MKNGCCVTKAALESHRLIPNREWIRPARHDMSLPMNSRANTHSAKPQLLCVPPCLLSITRRAIVGSCQFGGGLVQGRAQAGEAACRDRQGTWAPSGLPGGCSVAANYQRPDDGNVWPFHQKVLPWSSSNAFSPAFSQFFHNWCHFHLKNFECVIRKEAKSHFSGCSHHYVLFIFP